MDKKKEYKRILIFLVLGIGFMFIMNLFSDSEALLVPGTGMMFGWILYRSFFNPKGESFNVLAIKTVSQGMLIGGIVTLLLYGFIFLLIPSG